MPQSMTASLVHAVPGRMRIRLSRKHRSTEIMRALAQALSSVDGVRQVQSNPISGSVLLLYDPEVLGVESVLPAARAAGLDIVEPGSSLAADDPISPAALGINTAFGRLDSTVAKLTGGFIDAKTLVPLGFIAAAARRVATSGASLDNIPWHTLLWYAFGVFTSYNLKRGGEQQTSI
ncbi:MAG TPA: hypothetical protein VHS28_07030 [Chloroflexota bacterium]|nr:hypothetical protein [Chloroflexota bacterium]